MNRFKIILIFFLFSSCNQKSSKNIPPTAKKVSSSINFSSQKSSDIALLKLSEYKFFKGPISDLKPNDNVYSYKLNSALFSDYAFKERFIYVPENLNIIYQSENTFDFPDGSIIIKNFFYPKDFNDSKGERRILETRLMIKNSSEWIGLPYIWNKDQTDANLQVLGGETNVSWKHYDGTTKSTNYIIPNINQCKSCHLSDQKIIPIGVTARQLNRLNIYNNKMQNQLEYLHSINIIENLPNKVKLPKMADWSSDSYSVKERAIAYMDINCAHCHNPKGPAKNSGLNLSYYAKTDYERGIYKPPIAAGKGSGDLKYDIVPGDSENSIIAYRMLSHDPGIMMPEIGRTMVHKEGIQLINDYIDNLILKK